MTWGRRLYFPSEEIGARDFYQFYGFVNPSLWAGFEPAKLG
jgi:hypothetical protein